MVENIAIVNGLENTSILGSDIELDISSLLDLLPREERHEELKQVRVYCLIFSVFLCSVFHNIYFWFICIKVTLSIKEFFKNLKAMKTEKQKELIDSIASS